MYLISQNELYHHGILGMKWGIRRFQPYPKGHKGGKEVGEAAKAKEKKEKKEKVKKQLKVAAGYAAASTLTTSLHHGKEIINAMLYTTGVMKTGILNKDKHMATLGFKGIGKVLQYIGKTVIREDPVLNMLR